MNKSTYNDTIDYLKAAAIIMVVLGHAVGYYVNNINSGQMESTGIKCLRILVNSVHVQLFVAVAGYLNHEQDIPAYMWKKIKRLFIPYVTFTALKVIYAVFISSDFAHGDTLKDQIFDAVMLGNYYWFIYMILILYFAAPLLWKKDADNKSFLIKCVVICAVDIVLYVCVSGKITVNYFQIDNVISYIPFFVAGYAFKQCGFKTTGGGYKKCLIAVCLAGAAAFTYLRVCEVNITYIGWLAYGFMLIILLCLIAVKMPSDIKILKTIAKYSLQLMLFDSFYKVVLFAAAAKIVNINIVTAVVITILDIFLGCVSCMIAERIPILCTLVGLEYEGK